MLPRADPVVRAAIERFAHDGFGATLRTIAADAGVSAALLMKRFGSKDGLREACDEFVLEWIREVKTENIRATRRGTLMSALPAQEDQAVLIGYMMHSLLDGGDFGRIFVDHMIEDAESYVAEAVADGVAKPSRDERARARFMVQAGLGSLLVSMLLADPAERHDLAGMLRRLQVETALPSLELYTDGFFTSGTVLQEYLLYLSDPPSGTEASAEDATSPDPPDPA
ncbi:TetR family transcriptional regulator [Brachybacterium sp. GCM10030267]|uniref:TetR/AcrR family transcriptional regulator n=1 Tax=unclassified Brachybacterium TaxID=2623841 RepID=UPI00361E85AA